MPSIKESVGRGGKNRPSDVVAVQVLLNANSYPVAVDGLSSESLAQTIDVFQKEVVKLAKPDGKVSAAGNTIKKLNAAKKADIDAAIVGTVLEPVDDATAGFSVLSVPRFLAYYSKEFSNLGESASSGLTTLLNYIVSDPEVKDVRWAAYMLATAKHECADRWQPIREFGKGSGKTYGNPVTVKGDDGKDYTNTYYGRGYVQLTWKDNYETMSKALGLGDELLINPDKALDADTAYSIMSYGMRHGSFTPHKLSDHIQGKKKDYRTARRIINALDKADLIAGYAERLEIILRLSVVKMVRRLPADYDCIRPRFLMTR